MISSKGKSSISPGRWALSFADLSLILLAFFIMLHAQSGKQREMVDSVRAAFKSRMRPESDTHDLVAAKIFEPGEAIIRKQAQVQMYELAKAALKSEEPIVIESIGIDKDASRFDAWELAAARTAAVGRVLLRIGVKEENISLSIPKMAKAPDNQAHNQGQRIAVIIK